MTGPSRRAQRWLVTVALAVLLVPSFAVGARAGEVKVAVAANFTAAAKEIGRLFDAAGEHRAVFSFGSTGQLFTQIAQGAPFEVFLAADRASPARAEDEGLAVAGTQFTYATGRIVLFSADKARVAGTETLKSETFHRLAIANPETAPYGAAAVAAMRALGVYDALMPRIVRGNNIAQTFQFVMSGSAELGFVALSQVAEAEGGSRWVVPETMHPVIAQDAVLLQRGAENAAARAFLSFLRSAAAAEVKGRFGYGSGD